MVSYRGLVQIDALGIVIQESPSEIRRDVVLDSDRHSVSVVVVMVKKTKEKKRKKKEIHTM